MNNNSKKKIKKKYIFGIISLIAIVVLVSLTLLNGKDVYAYAEETVKISDITTYYNFAGTVESKSSLTMVSEKMMQISEVLIKEGDKVNKDDVLFRTTQDDEIHAKIDGEITTLYVEEGSAVAGGIKLCDIMNLDDLEVKIKVDEYDLSCIKEEEEVNVNIGALDKDIKGTVSSVSKTAISNNGLSYFTATIDLNPDDLIKVGMSAEATILNKEAKGVLTIPMKAIQFEKDTNEPYVFIKDEKEKPIKHPITVGINDGINVEITSGLNNGEQILYPNNTNSETTNLFPTMSNGAR